MTTLVFGTGVGTFTLLAVWSAALFFCFISLKTNRNVGPIATVIAVLVMVVLLLIPRGPETPSPAENKIYDNLFIWRVLLTVFLGLSAFGSIVAFFTLNLMESKQGQRIKEMAAAMMTCLRQRALLNRSISCARSLLKSFTINDNEEFMDKVMNSPVPVIVNFHAEWCEPCHILTPKLEELIANSDSINLATVDVEKNAELVHTFEVKAVPAVIAIRNGLVIDKFIGLVDGNMIDNLVQRLTPPKQIKI